MFKSGRKQSQGTVLDAVRCSSSTAVSRGVFLNPNEVILGEPIALPLLSFLPTSHLPSANFCIIHSFFLPRSRNKEIRDQKQTRIFMGCLSSALSSPIPSKGLLESTQEDATPLAVSVKGSARQTERRGAGKFCTSPRPPRLDN